MEETKFGLVYMRPGTRITAKNKTKLNKKRCSHRRKLCALLFHSITFLVVLYTGDQKFSHIHFDETQIYLVSIFPFTKSFQVI